ncbi:MAG: hypothetical protein JW731_05120 [Bacteroidales bacterium]|nr:hypothetical protein [Bacteroidales bacterium]
MINYYEIQSGLKQVSSSKLISSFEVLLPANKSISYLTTDNSGNQLSIIRYYLVNDDSDEDIFPASHTLGWDGEYHKVVIEINSDEETTGGNVARKIDIAE